MTRGTGSGTMTSLPTGRRTSSRSSSTCSEEATANPRRAWASRSAGRGDTAARGSDGRVHPRDGRAVALVVVLALAPLFVRPALAAGAAAAAAAAPAPPPEPPPQAPGGAPPNRIFFMTGPAVALWPTEHDAAPTWLGDEHGGLLVLRVGYERDVASHLAVGATLIIDIETDAPPFAPGGGAAVAGELRIDVVRPYLSLRLGLFAGYPRGVGLTGALGVRLPFSDGVFFLIENRFDVALFGQGDWFAMWLPTIGAEFPF